MKKLILLTLALLAINGTTLMAKHYNDLIGTFDDTGTPMLKPSKENVCKALISRLKQAARIIDNFVTKYSEHLTEDTKDRATTLSNQLKDFECAKLQQLETLMRDKMSEV